MLEGKIWQKNHGASKEAVMNLTSVAPFPLPESYVNFLSHSNGGEGPLSLQPDWLILHPAEEVTENETSGAFHHFFPGHFVIGGSGGGEAIALKIGNDGRENVVYFDMTNIDFQESTVVLAPSFDGLISLLENHTD